MKIILKAIIFLFLFTACYSSPEYIKLSNHAISSFSKEVFYTDELLLIGAGGALHEDIKILSLAFESRKELNLEKARKLFINTTEHFLSDINNNSSIKSYLHTYPMTIKNLHLSISFYNGQDRVKSNFIAFITIPNINPDKPTDRIYYAIYDQNADILVDIHSETYQEALLALGLGTQDI